MTTGGTTRLAIILLSLVFLHNISHAVRLISVSTCENVAGTELMPRNITDKFQADSPNIHALLVLDQVKASLKIKGVWVSIDAIDIPDYRIDSSIVILKESESRIHFQLSRPTNGWPVGSYRLEVYFDDNFVTAAPFSISKANSAAKKVTDVKSPSSKAGNDLLGVWECSTQLGTSYLEFKSADVVVFDGEPFRYCRKGSLLQIEGEDGYTDYPYTLKNGVLSITFPEGYTMSFKRSSTRPQYIYEDQEGYSSGYDEQQESNRPIAGSPSNLMQHFAGTWWSASTNTEINVTFTADGMFYENSSSSYSGSSSDQYGNPDLSWGAANDNRVSGTWSVRGDTEQGVITIRYQSGNQREVQYRVHVENGQTFWNEYLFNGVLYGKR